MFEKIKSKNTQRNIGSGTFEDNNAKSRFDIKLDQKCDNKNEIVTDKINLEISPNFLRFLPDNSEIKFADDSHIDASLVLESRRADKTNIDGSIVGLPNLTLSKTQSDMKRIKKSTPKKRKTVKEMKKEIEMRSEGQITHFFKKEVKIEQKDYSGKSN